jgi:hypothetical protein
MKVLWFYGTAVVFGLATAFVVAVLVDVAPRERVDCADCADLVEHVFADSLRRQWADACRATGGRPAWVYEQGGTGDFECLMTSRHIAPPQP